MYLAIILLPLLASIASGFFGRKIGVSASHLITRIYALLATTLAILTSLSLVAFPFMTGFYSKDFILESAYGQFTISSISVYFISTIGAMLFLIPKVLGESYTSIFKKVFSTISITLHKLLWSKPAIILFFPLLITGIKIFPSFAVSELGIEIMIYISYLYFLGLGVFFKMSIMVVGNNNGIITFRKFFLYFSMHVIISLLLGLVLNVTGIDNIFMLAGAEYVMLSCGFCPQCIQDAPAFLTELRNSILNNTSRLVPLVRIRAHALLNGNLSNAELYHNLTRIATHVGRVEAALTTEYSVRAELARRGHPVPYWQIPASQARNLNIGKSYLPNQI